MVWAWLLWSSDAVLHERYHGLCMDALVTACSRTFWDALVIGCGRTGTLLWFGHGCSGHRMQSNVNVILAFAWMLRSSNAVLHERCYGLGMDALVVRCNGT